MRRLPKTHHTVLVVLLIRQRCLCVAVQGGAVTSALCNITHQAEGERRRSQQQQGCCQKQCHGPAEAHYCRGAGEDIRCVYVCACKPKVKQQLRAEGARVSIECKCGCKEGLEYKAGDVTGAKSCQCVPCPVHRSQMEAATLDACYRRDGALSPAGRPSRVAPHRTWPQYSRSFHVAMRDDGATSIRITMRRLERGKD